MIALTEAERYAGQLDVWRGLVARLNDPSRRALREARLKREQGEPPSP